MKKAEPRFNLHVPGQEPLADEVLRMHLREVMDAAQAFQRQKGLTVGLVILAAAGDRLQYASNLPPVIGRILLEQVLAQRFEDKPTEVRSGATK